MANNSSLLKGWAVTLIAGIFALASIDADKLFFIVAYLPVIIFWGLDSYYLLKERLFRALYNKVRVLPEEDINFDMDTSLDEFKTDKNTWCSCLLSPTEFWFYFPLAIVCTGVIILISVL
jgi:hypothetical protein